MHRRRTIAAAALVAAVTGPVLLAAPSQAASRPTFTLKVAHGSVVEGKRLHIDGLVTPGKHRPIDVQEKLDGHWEDVFGFLTDARGDADLDALAVGPGKHELRAFAPHYKSYKAVHSNVVSWTVIAKTAVRASFSPAAPAVGQATVLSAKLHPASTGRVVHVQRLVDGAWVAFKTVTSDKGHVSVAVPTTSTAKSSYRFVIAARKSSTALTSKAYSVTPAYATSVSAELGSASVGYGSTVQVGGTVTSADRAGRQVALQRRSGSAWTSVASTTAAANGTYALSTTATAVGSANYRVVVAAATHAKAATSATLALTVTKSGVLVGATPSATTVSYGSTFSVSGGLLGLHVGVGDAPQATLQRLVDGVWTTDQSVYVDTDASSFDFAQVTPYAFGDQTYRVVTDATQDSQAGVSATFTVQVVDPVPAT